MNIFGDIFNSLFFGPIINLLVLTYHALTGVHIPGAFGLAIVLLTIAIRLLIAPFIAAQLRSTKKMSDLKPQLEALSKKHAKDKQSLAQAQMALYKEHGINPAAGCLPSLIQMPVVIALYQTIQASFDGQHGLDKLNGFIYSPSWKLSNTPDLHFLGINLASKPSEFATAGVLLLLVPLLTAGLQFVQSKMMTPLPVKPYPSDSKKELEEKEKTQDTMSAVQSQMTFMLPLMIGFFSWTLPIGVSVYWNTFTIIGIVQQYMIGGWGGMTPWIHRLAPSANR
ncbi:hypothetical protein A2631_05185 [Candidatus Daviesbacteria bacterium RIFCSPHIGHO2_01_FULL_44_29]|nr:MAG: hypothetical protein A2631_05185 [Candidatus Daviesbacteria bacterium RIFCSPHIGHO2_01_FULL_44_29]OGE41062.1 MAG: hypothetical protein A3E86_05010 [Candidatus Daviesbacteria bacterium RIFCSPHIGHO2_12_FULL_47_45]OGE70205.1 MAG: hypothetical protein A3B55_00655 [Candidatus Daviesbacteria bacterium RIFCSPLOWO2_01_FULL_43_15]